jgi:hypothetical protein
VPWFILEFGGYKGFGKYYKVGFSLLNMRPRNKALLTFTILIFMISGMYLFTDWFSKTTGYVLGEDEKLRLAQCLTGEESVLYVSSSCLACKKQTELFGETALKFLEIEVCDEIEKCPELRGVPSWHIRGEFYYGVQELNELIEISGCVVD